MRKVEAEDLKESLLEDFSSKGRGTKPGRDSFRGAERPDGLAQLKVCNVRTQRET